MKSEPGSLAAYFDGWYAEMTGSPVKDEIQQRHLGLPPQLLSTSLLGWDGIAEVAAGLRLSAGGALVDLACGRGGYGLEIAARTGAQLTGVDFSAEAVRQAREQARRRGAAADFRVGDLAWTGLAAVDLGDERLPGRLRQVSLAAALTAAGFEQVEVRDRPGWRTRERSMWEEAAAPDPGDDPALRSFHDEGVRSLNTSGLVRRVIATATAP